jgi:hypothetical protein
VTTLPLFEAVLREPASGGSRIPLGRADAVPVVAPDVKRGGSFRRPLKAEPPPVTVSNVYEWAEETKAGNERLAAGLYKRWDDFREYSWEFSQLASRTVDKANRSRGELREALFYLAKMQRRISETYLRIFNEKKATL